MCGGFMEDNVLKKLVKNVKNKFNKNDKSYPSMDYAFSMEEIDNLSKDNKEKIFKLKNNVVTDEKTVKDKVVEEVLSPIEGVTKIDANIDIKDIDDVLLDDKVEEEDNDSFINLSSRSQSIVMNEWKNIDISLIEKDIMIGKTLANQSYMGSYTDDAMRYIHNIRKKYEVVITYLIGFNNEKKGFVNKTFFSDNKEEEWIYLNNYIKVLEKIRDNKK